MTRKLDLESVLAELGPSLRKCAPELDARDAFAADAYAALRARKVFSALVPARLGGGDASHAEMCAFLRGLAGYCPATALALSMHQHLVAAAVANEQAGRASPQLLEKVAVGETVLVSTGANDWLASNGTARPVAGGYRVTATKPFASGSPAGDILVTSAVLDDPAEGAQVLHFPVPLTAEGVSLADDWQALGMRGTGSHTVRLEEVFVPAETLVLRRPRGPFHPAFAVILTVAMPLIMSVYLGVAETGAVIARDRAAAARDADTMAPLTGEMEALLATAELATADMIRMAEGYAFTPSAELASRVLVRKTIAAENAIGALGKAMELAGGAGYYRSLGLERLWRDVQGARFHPLPRHRQQLFTGRLALGIDPVAPAPISAADHAA